MKPEITKTTDPNGTSETCHKCGGEVKVMQFNKPSGGIPYRVRFCRQCQKDDEQKREARMQGAREVQIDRRLNEAEIIGNLKKKNLDSFDDRNIGTSSLLNIATKFIIQGGPTWLLLAGKTGTGKSHLAIAIGIAVIQSSALGVHYTKMLTLMQRIRATFGRDPMETEKGICDQLKKIPLLLLDEYGLRDQISDWERAILDDILDHRWEQRKLTIIITNMTSGEFFRSSGDRIESRFADIGKIIDFTWDDYRIERRQAKYSPKGS